MTDESGLAKLWDAQADWMRKVGATHAEWNPMGTVLVCLTLGDAPTPPDVEDPTQRKLSAAELDQRSRDERRRIALGASGGPVKRILDPTRP